MNIIEKLKDRKKHNKSNEDMKLLCDFIDELMIEKDFNESKKVIKYFLGNNFHIKLYIGLLSITLRYRNHLNPERLELFQEAKNIALEHFNGNIMQTNSLLIGLG